jgi:hypothetical protein
MVDLTQPYGMLAVHFVAGEFRDDSPIFLLKTDLELET